MTKATRWAWVISLVAFLGIALVIGFVLALTGNTRSFYERNFTWLLWLNVAVAMLLGLVIALAAARLATRIRRRKFGSNLLLKLAGIFALVGVLPGVLIYTVSYQFVSRSIEIWFDERVEGALDAGLALGRGSLDALQRDLSTKTRLAAERFGDTRAATTTIALERLREQLSAQEVALVGTQGQVLVVAGGSSIAIERPSLALLRQARSSRVASAIEGLDDDTAPRTSAANARVRAIALIASTDLNFGRDDRFLWVTQTIPTQIAANALEVQAAYREYQQRAVARSGLRKMYIGTLTLALVLAVFGAVLLAVLLGNQLAKPLLLLAEGMKQVAAGDLTAKPVSVSRDEIGGLTRSFAVMTEQLGQARAEVERGVHDLEQARTHLQTVLDSLTAGVLVVDAEGVIKTANPGAARILRLSGDAAADAHLDQSASVAPGLQAFAQSVMPRFALHQTSPEAGEVDFWQESMERKSSDGSMINLLVRGAPLPQGAKLIVFDDITEVVSAQRSAAWSEVARRLAHEIKNPLTPIQLSAERLQMKLHAKLPTGEQTILDRSVATIVAQVQSMKQLVDEFRDYARLPAAKLEPVDLNALVREVLVLYGEPIEHGQLVPRLDPDMPAILGDQTQLRQVIHNLVQNGLDAVGSDAHAHVCVQTQVARTDDGGVRAVRLNVMDTGPGFSQAVLKRAFEPYVTTKHKGTGLGLAVVKKIADEHGARVRLGNLPRGWWLGSSLGAGAGAHDAPAPSAPTLRGDPEGAEGTRLEPLQVGGAQVSLSFSKLAPTSVPALARGASASLGEPPATKVGQA